MKTIEIIGSVDADHRLTAEVPSEIPPGKVRLALVVATTDGEETDFDWGAWIAKEWADELSDSTQDIYTLADGEPVNETR